jgi:hypothetical protein
MNDSKRVAAVTGQRETTRYATPVLRRWRDSACVLSDGASAIAERWIVHAEGHMIGVITQVASGWTAMTQRGAYAGLWPTKQAAAEVLVKQAGYELEMT